MSRWYREGGAGEPWDGVLHAREKIRVNVIGDIPEKVRPGTEIDAAIALGSVAIKAKGEARAVIHLHVR